MAMSNKVKSALGALAAVAVVGTGIGVATANASSPPTPAASSQVQTQDQQPQGQSAPQDGQMQGAPDGDHGPRGDMEQALASQLASALKLDESTVLKALQEVRQELMGQDEGQPPSDQSGTQNTQPAQTDQGAQTGQNDQGGGHRGGPRGGMDQTMQASLAKALAAKLNVNEADVLAALQNMQPPTNQQSQTTNGSTTDR